MRDSSKKRRRRRNEEQEGEEKEGKEEETISAFKELQIFLGRRHVNIMAIEFMSCLHRVRE